MRMTAPGTTLGRFLIRSKNDPLNSSWKWVPAPCNIMSDKLIPYSASQGHSPFDWNAFLKKEVSELTLTELKEAVKLSIGWVACACGNQCAILPRDKVGVPKDGILRNHGVGFYAQIAGMMVRFEAGNDAGVIWYRDGARKILEQIEERSSELLQEMGATTL